MDAAGVRLRQSTSESQGNASPIHGASSAAKGTELEDAPGTVNKADTIEESSGAGHRKSRTHHKRCRSITTVK